MNNLTTRKIVLGMLMALVLALGVQGIADAVTLAEGTGDLQDITVESQTFTITFTVGLTDRELVNSNYREIPDTHAAVQGVTGTYYYDFSKYYVTDSAPDPNPNKLSALTSSRRISEAAAYYHNEEAVQIDIPSSGIVLTAPVSSTSDVTLTETVESDDSRNLDRYISNVDDSITVTGYATTAGEKTISIIDKTPSPDRDGDAADEKLTYKIYVVKLNHQVPDSASIKLANITNGFAVGYYDGRGAQLLYKGDNSHYPVKYQITNGTAYVQETTDRRTTASADFTTSSAAAVYFSKMTGESTRVTATVAGNRVVGVYIHGYPTLTVTTVPDPLSGSPGETHENAITATVKDEAENNISGVPVMFEVADKSDRGGYLIPADAILVDAANKEIDSEDRPLAARELYVRTETGIAVVDLELGTAPGKFDITVKSVNKTEKVKVEVTSDQTAKTLSTVSKLRRSGDSDIYDLVALVEENGVKKVGEPVIFRALQGTLTNTPANPGTDNANVVTGRTVTQVTNNVGLARVIYDIGDYSGRQEIDASIDDATDDRQVETFVINGSATTIMTRTPSLVITTSREGATRTATVTATDAQGTDVPGLAVALSGTALTTPRVATTGTPETVTLPSTPGDYTLLATAPGFTLARVNLTVAAAPQPGTLTIERVGDRIGNQQSIRVTAQTSGGSPPSSALLVTLSGVTLPPRVIIPAGAGSISVTATLPSASSAHVLTADATGYDDDSVIIPATGQPTGSTPPPPGPVGAADSLEIDGNRQLSGTVNQAMRLRVRVLDANGNGVDDVRVTFRVLAPGRGRLSQRGNGRATQDTTDSRGYASANLTPLDDGDIIVRANAAGVPAPVTFIIDVGEADDDDTEPSPPSRDEPTSRDISPVVHVGVSSRPPMLWVDGGAIYALVGADAQKFAPSVDNALNIVIGGGKVYWTEKTGESGGTINSANLNGSDVTELTSIKAVPMGIAVDAAGSKLYWTNSRGRIQSANLDGSGITNVIPGGLESPMDLALAGSNLYWTQGNGSVRVVNLRGQQVVRNVSTGTDTPGSVVVGGNKVYWTEMTGDSSGTINSANLSGTDVTELTSIQAVPMGIAVDGSRSKLYWTNSRGRVQSANLDGSGITNVVSGLGSPGELVLSNSIAAPAAAPAETASGSKYDVNGDGTVDNADSDAVTVAIAAGATDAKYDVNGDGTVNVFDLVEIIANRDPGAAGAPTLFGMKMTAVQIDHLQEQIDLLIATNDRSPAAMRTLVYLQQLLVTARPEKTLLLANYPNPFNPETWIPYELATDTDVRLTIYNTQGVVIRTLQFGHQSAGYYTGRDRAAYWDGRNALGEQVASGLYFYQLETDEMSLMRKMVILK